MTGTGKEAGGKKRGHDSKYSKVKEKVEYHNEKERDGVEMGKSLHLG